MSYLSSLFGGSQTNEANVVNEYGNETSRFLQQQTEIECNKRDIIWEKIEEYQTAIEQCKSNQLQSKNIARISGLAVVGAIFAVALNPATPIPMMILGVGSIVGFSRSRALHELSLPLKDLTQQLKESEEEIIKHIDKAVTCQNLIIENEKARSKQIKNNNSY